MAKINEIAIVLRYLAEVYQVQVTKEKARAYHSVMGNIDRMRIVEAATLWVSKEKWFPKPSELIGCLPKGGKTFDPTTEAAWWFAFAHGYESTDDLTEADVAAVYADAGVPMVGDVRLPAGAINRDPDVLNFKHREVTV